MKHDWKYIKLGDIISPAKVVRNGANKKFPVLSITMRDGIVLQSSRFKKSIASVDTSDYKVVYNGQLVIAFPIDEGLIYTQDIVDAGIMSPAYNVWNVDFLEIDRKFLVLYLHCPFSMAYYKSKLRGTTMRRRSMPKEDLLNMPLPVPSFSVQQSIVSELDKINELIRLKKEQLNDYDKLSQSIFYEMFGDPVVNEKGWEVKRITDLCIEISAGGDASKHEIKKTKDEIFSVPVYSNGIDEDGLYGYSNHATIIQPAITLAARGTIGAAFIRTEPYIPIIRLVSVIPDLSKISLTYLFYILKQTEWDRTGGTIPQLPVPKVKQLTLPLPPLPLQQTFAQRIKLIERQKAEIQSTIADLETLLASRMQYWFD